MSPEFRAAEVPYTAPAIRCSCGERMSDPDAVVFDEDGYSQTLDAAQGDGAEEGDIFCSEDCATYTRCDNRAAEWFEDAAYGVAPRANRGADDDGYRW